MSEATKRLINAAEWVVTIFTDDTLDHERGNLDDWLHELNNAIIEAEKEQQSVPVSDGVVDSIAQELAAEFDYPWEYMPQQGREDFRQKVRKIAAMLAEAEKEQQNVPVATVIEYVNKTKSVTWRDRDLYDIPNGTVLYAQKGTSE